MMMKRRQTIALATLLLDEEEARNIKLTKNKKGHGLFNHGFNGGGKRVSAYHSIFKQPLVIPFRHPCF